MRRYPNCFDTFALFLINLPPVVCVRVHLSAMVVRDVCMCLFLRMQFVYVCVWVSFVEHV